MQTKKISELCKGDRVCLEEPEGAALVTSIQRRREMDVIQHVAGGGAYAINLKVIDGPHKGETMTNQLYHGNQEVSLVGAGS
jgi:hypothetical protein